MTFDEMYVNANAYGRRYRTVATLAHWIFEHPNDKIQLCTASEEEAVRVMAQLQLLYGLKGENVTVETTEE